MMGSQPASAASTCGRSRPWVSEIAPMVRITPDQTTRGATCAGQAILNERMFFGSFVPTVSHVAADRPIQQRQSLQERPDAGLKYRIARRCGDEHADPPHPLALLRARRERPCGHPEQRDERAPFQLIELHAVPTSEGRITGYRI